MVGFKNWYTLFKIRMKNIRIYRFDFISSLIGMMIPIVGLAIYWTSIFSGQISASYTLNFNATTIILYYIIAFLIEILLSFEVAFSIEEDIAEGRLNYYLMMPCDYLTIKLSEYVVLNFFSVCLLLIAFIGIGLFSEIQISMGSAISFLILILLGNVFQFLFISTLGLLTVWFKKISGMLYFAQTIIGLLSGVVLPISMFPNWLQWIKWNPFSLSIYVPSEMILNGNIVLVELIVLAGWCILMYMLYQFVWKKALKQYQAFGG